MANSYFSGTDGFLILKLVFPQVSDFLLLYEHLCSDAHEQYKGKKNVLPAP